METTVFIVILLAIALLAGILRLRSGKRGKRGAYERDLLRQCHGDRSLAERLIDLERKRNSQLSREKAARNAIDSLRRDRG